jgi:hypothetical protein
MSDLPAKPDDSGLKPADFKPTDKPVAKFDAQPADKSSPKSESKSELKPDDRAKDKPTDKPASKPNDRGTDKSSSKSKVRGKANSSVWLWLSIHLLGNSLIDMLLILLMVHRRIPAIAGIVVLLLLPAITTLTDYTLSAWGYLLSGVVIFAALIFWIHANPVTLIVAAIVWLGIIAIPISVQKMIGASFSRITTIFVLTFLSLFGLAIAWATVWLQS